MSCFISQLNNSLSRKADTVSSQSEKDENSVIILLFMMRNYSPGYLFIDSQLVVVDSHFVCWK